MSKPYFLKTRLLYYTFKYAILQGWYQGWDGDENSPRSRAYNNLSQQYRDAWIEDFNK